MRRSTTLLPLLLLVGAGCAASTQSARLGFGPPSGVHAVAAPELGAYRIRRIAVLPFRNESKVQGAGDKIAGIFYKGLAASPRYIVHPPPQVGEKEGFSFEFRLRGGRPQGVRNQAADSEWLKKTVDRFISTVQPYLTNLDAIYPGEYFEGKMEAEDKETLKGTVVKAAERSDEEAPLDAVVTGVVTRFQDRSGNAVLGEKGAHVSYSVFLVSTKDGKVLWRATFNEEQIYLLDNLLLLPRYAKAGFLWQTNEALAQNGLERLLAAFPGWKDQLVVKKSAKK
ncbi:MAG: hypothetical protein V3V62_15810 [bacterium]